MYNMLGPLDLPTSFWDTAFRYLRYNTEDDYRLKAFKRLEAIDTWVRVLSYSNDVKAALFEQ